MDVKDLSALSIEELTQKEKQLRQELFNFRFQLGIGRLENPMQVRATKRDIARVKTVKRQLELLQGQAGQAVEK
ncbi:MAG: 50S ribosomal protein L29 [Nitrospira sp.]|jgi:large subunit ribosomal protein L29|nr:50S ribosomal protein L29 [Nitrospira sp.]MDR4475862.1 50S ribosomal protein L29 [Nitrospira sp.]HAP42404.1 50S ribosomal protein L29 [Nitrospira sp.]